MLRLGFRHHRQHGGTSSRGITGRLIRVWASQTSLRAGSRGTQDGSGASRGRRPWTRSTPETKNNLRSAEGRDELWVEDGGGEAGAHMMAVELFGDGGRGRRWRRRARGSEVSEGQIRRRGGGSRWAATGSEVADGTAADGVVDGARVRGSGSSSGCGEFRQPFGMRKRRSRRLSRFGGAWGYS